MVRASSWNGSASTLVTPDALVIVPGSGSTLIRESCTARRTCSTTPSTLGLGRESDRHVSLLGDTDHRHRSRNAGDQSIGERAAFVQHELGMDVARREQIRDAGRAAPPAHLLIVAEREIHGAARLGSRPEEMLHRLAESDEAALVVERAPAPHISAGDPALEWRLGPAGLRAGLDRNHVLMSQQYDRWDTRIGSWPLVQQAVAVHFLELERGMELWERGSQVALEAIELTGVELARILIGDGLEAQRAGQALRERRRVERLDRHRRRLGLARAERERALEYDDREDHHHAEQGAENPLHNSSLASLR